MKLEVQNLGPIHHGSIELGDFTVVCGMNNTGKSYLAHTIYGFLRSWRNYVIFTGKDFDQEIKVKPVEIDLDQPSLNANGLLEAASPRYGEFLYTVLSGPESRFKDTVLKFSVTSDGSYKSRHYSSIASLGSKQVILGLQKIAGDSSFKVSLTGDGAGLPPGVLGKFIDDALAELLLSASLPRPFILSSERTGAETFRSELNLTKNRLIEAAQQLKQSDRSGPVIFREFMNSSSYPTPIRDNLDFMNTQSTNSLRLSYIGKQYLDVLEDFSDLIGGDLKRDGSNGELTFHPANAPGVKLSMTESSSAVRSLVMLGLYLRHTANGGDLLIIDEPELNLHPENQRRLARLLAKLSNIGLKIFITTHSDYIVRELNNLIVLKGLEGRADEFLTKHPEYKRAQFLAGSNFRLYTLVPEDPIGLREVRAKKSESVRIIQEAISQENGISSTTFDKTIEDLDTVLYDLIDAGESRPLVGN